MLRQFRLSVRPSVTRVYYIKTAECIIGILSPSDRSLSGVWGRAKRQRKQYLVHFSLEI